MPAHEGPERGIAPVLGGGCMGHRTSAMGTKKAGTPLDPGPAIPSAERVSRMVHGAPVCASGGCETMREEPSPLQGSLRRALAALVEEGLWG